MTKKAPTVVMTRAGLFFTTLDDMTTLLELMRARWSCRRYKTDPVPRAMVETMLEAARLAPSACNRQPWRFAVVTDSTQRQRLFDEGFLPGLGMKWALEAPVMLVLGLARVLVTHTLAPKISGVEYPLLDLGIAGEHAVLQAAELGLGTCWIGWIKPAAVRRVVGWPASVQAQAVITVGWPADSARPAATRRDLRELVTWC